MKRDNNATTNFSKSQLAKRSDRRRRLRLSSEALEPRLVLTVPGYAIDDLDFGDAPVFGEPIAVLPIELIEEGLEKEPDSKEGKVKGPLIKEPKDDPNNRVVVGGYPTLLAQDGARHMIGGPILGWHVDGEPDGQPTPFADGDDMMGLMGGAPYVISPFVIGGEMVEVEPPGYIIVEPGEMGLGDDEDGVFFNTPLMPGSIVPVDFHVSGTVGGNAHVDAWIDFNADDDWADAGERIIGTADGSFAYGDHSVLVSVPTGAQVGDTFSRFRISTDGGLEPTGMAPDGEVEDHLVSIVASADAEVTLDLPVGGGDFQVDQGPNGELQVRDGSGNLLAQYPSDIGKLTINGSDGDDWLRVGSAPGHEPFVFFDIIIEFNGGLGNDGMSVAGNDVETATYSPSTTPGTTGKAGTVVVDATTINFDGLEPLDVSGMAASTVSFLGLDDVVDVNNGFDFATGTVDAIIVSGTTGGVPIEDVAFFNNGSVTIDTTTMDGDDTITVFGADNILADNTSFSILTGSGADKVTVAGGILQPTAGDVLIDTVEIETHAPVVTMGTGMITFDAERSIQVNNIIQSDDGTVSLTADGTVAGDYQGIWLSGPGGTVQSDTGDINLDGTSSAGPNFGLGVFLDRTSVETDGAITITGSSEGTVDNNIGVVSFDSTIDGQANVTIMGTGSIAAAGNNNDGVEINGKEVLSDGLILIDGFAGSGIHGNQGVTIGISLPTLVESGADAVFITGDGGGTGGGNDNTGIEVHNGIVRGVDSVRMFGFGGDDGVFGNRGVFISGRVESFGAIDITGDGGGMSTGSDNSGVKLVGAGSVKTIGAATVSITGIAYEGVGDQRGVWLEAGTVEVSSNGGDIGIFGQGGGTAAVAGGGNIGVSMDNGSLIKTNGIGSITIFGDSGDSSDGYHMGVEGVGATIQTVDGPIDISGLSIASNPTGMSFDNKGVQFRSGTVVETIGFGDIIVDGNGGMGVSANAGVSAFDPGTEVKTVDGSITITGNAGDGSDVLNLGVWIENGPTVESTGLGDVTLDGTGGDGGTFDNGGVQINGTASVKVADGDLSITGVGGDGTMSHNYGVRFRGGSAEATGTGDITIDGTGGNGGTDWLAGVLIDAGGGPLVALSSDSGDINITGTGGDGSGDLSHGVGIVGGSREVRSNNGGNISITGMGGGTPTSGEINIGVAFVGATVETNLGGTINIDGDGGLGTGVAHIGVDGVNTTVNTVDGLIDIVGVSHADNTADAHFGTQFRANSLVEATGIGGIVIDGSGGDGQNGNPGVRLDDMSEVKTGTGSIDIAGLSKAKGDDNHGVHVRNSKVTSSGGDIEIIGVDNSSAGKQNDGIHTFGAALISTAGGGNITLLGTGGASVGDFISGVDVGGGVTTVDGDISISGDTFGAGDRADGVVVFGNPVESTGTGTVTIDGFALGTGSGSGVRIQGPGDVLSSSGDIDITGVAIGDPTNPQTGVLITNSAQVSAANANVSIEGTAPVNMGDGVRIDSVPFLDDAQVAVTTAGDIHIRGEGTIGFAGSSANPVLINGGTATVELPGANVGEFTGVISGSGNFVKAGTGTLDLKSPVVHTYGGTTQVAAGTLLVNGQIGMGQVTVDPGATLGGDGIVNAPVNATGTVSPGNSPGILSSGSVNFMAGSSFAVEIDSPGGPTNAGVTYDQLVVTGTVTIDPTATLDITSTAVTLPDSFLLIDNDGTGDDDLVVGEFQGLGEGMSLTVGGETLYITYAGGDGNDVVLYSSVMVEFNDDFSDADEHEPAATSDGPTIAIKGDLTNLSEAQRTLNYAVTHTETTIADFANNPFVIPAMNYSSGGLINMIQANVLVINNDTLLEGDEEFKLTIANNGVFVLGDVNGVDGPVDEADHDILDDETGTLSIVSANKPESPTTVDTLLTITGTPSGGPFQLAGEVTLTADVVDATTGSAIPNPLPSADYEYVPATAMFAPGSFSGSVFSAPLNIFPDAAAEADETINFELTNLMDGRTASNNLEGHVSTSNGTVTIVDDDAFLIITQTDISTDVTEGGATDTYTIQLGGVPVADVPVTVFPVSGQLDLGNGPGNSITVTFTPVNAMVPQTVTVTAVDDVIVEGPHSDVIGHVATGSDPNYSSLPVTSFPVNITDNDMAVTPAIVIVDSGIAVTEGGATDTYTVALASVPTGNVDVTVTPDGQLDLGAGAGTAVTLNFTPGDALTPQTVTVTAFDDVIFENVHLGAITHTATSSDPNYNGLAGSGITAVITDNDLPPVPFTPTDISVSSSSWAGTPYQLTNNLSHAGVSGHHGRTLPWINLDTITVAYVGIDPTAGDLVLSDASLVTTFVGAGGGTATWTVTDAANPLAGVVAGVTNQIGPKDDLTVTAGGALAVTVDVVPGDINSSLTTDIGDVLDWVPLLGSSTLATAPPSFSDVDGSGLTDVGDVLAIILANGSSSTPAAADLDNLFASENDSTPRGVDFGVDIDAIDESRTDDLNSRSRRRLTSRRDRSIATSDAATDNVDDVFASLDGDSRFGQL